MKLSIFLLSAFLIAGCSNDNSNVPGETSADDATTEKKTGETASSAATQNDNIVGEWEMVGSVVDTNDNLLIDEDERKNLETPSFKDYMKLNSDGTGLFTVARMEGRYEVKPKDTGAKDYLTWYDKANGPHGVGTIIKVTKEELHIKEPGGHGLFLWKRL